jgi:polyisoprenoid-binding protein YceI
MKAIFKLIITLLVVCFSLPLSAQLYTFDPLHSSIVWHINHFGFSNPSGKFFATGTIDYDPKSPQNSKVTATIDLNNLVTGIPDLDKHLKGKLFFNVMQFPSASFVSDKVIISQQEISAVQGQLTLHGVTKPIILTVKLNKMGKNPITEKDSIGFSASTKLKRSDFGMNTLLPDVSDDVDVSIEIEAAA